MIGTLAAVPIMKPANNLVDVSDIFYFFLLGEGEGGVQGAGRGVIGFFLS